MSEYGKTDPYEAYDYHIGARPDGGHGYSGFAAPPNYPADYVTTPTQVPSGLPQSSTPLALLPSAQQYGTHDAAYYGHQAGSFPAYLDATPRPSPGITSYTPNQGHEGTKVTVYFQSLFDFDAPQIAPVIMFGQKRCQSLLMRNGSEAHAYHYALSTNAPSLQSLNSSTPKIPLRLALDGGPVVWESPVLDFGSFTYLDEPSYYQLDSPEISTEMPAPRKRKLSIDAGSRRSPPKRSSMYPLGGQPSPSIAAAPTSPFRRSSLPDSYGHARRFSTPVDYQQSYTAPLPPMPTSNFYGHGPQTTLSLQTAPSPSWSWHPASVTTTRSPPAAASVTAAGKTPRLLQSPAARDANPPLIRTSTIQQSPTAPSASTAATPGFNPYAIYPANSKAMLKIDGDLGTMTDKWTPAEWEVGRRLVQFQRSQTGSLITATFAPVTLEERAPNSICVSCIWWEEKQECYVTSVDTISLLESLVGVRFTVEEKNRIRRNLEGFRPATVSKTKRDCEEFFKLIMGFPNPKPRNIEKDVKVFPWRILATALKKIIGKYSASYSSTAGTLHTPSSSSYPGGRPTDSSAEARRATSPHSTTSSSAASRGNVYTSAAVTSAYSPHATGLGIAASAGPPELHLAVPTSAAPSATSWHPLSAQYSSELAAANRAWDMSGYMSAPPATGLPGSAQSFHYQQRVSSLTGAVAVPSEARFVPLQNYEGRSQPTSTTA